MPKQLLIFVLTLFSVCAFSQNSFYIKGKIIEEATKLPMESATVYLSLAKDSSLVDYTITDKNGNFSLPVKKITQPVFLKVSMEGFEAHKQSLNELLKAADFGVISLKEQAKMLNEVIVKAEAPPIRIKKDTLEFNAASFKVRPDTNVETLLKQLPGVEIDPEGKITVNGKEVTQIMVNGKPFFDKDGKVALQNLPSDIINKIQVSDLKTKKEELSGQAASSDKATINLTIDEDKNKGLFGKFMGGYGTDDRYEASGLLNYFKNKRKFSVLASSNNINSIGFSMDEIFDNMGGGRSRSMYYNDNGSFGVNGMLFGSGVGITQSDMIGVNYSDEWVKGFDSNGNYLFSDQHTKNNRKVKQANFLPTGGIITDGTSQTSSDRFGHNLNFEFEYKIDSTTTIGITPRFSKSHGKDRDKSFQSSTDENNNLLNESNSDIYNESDGNSFKNSLYFNKAFKRKGRYVHFTFDNENNKDEINSTNTSTTIFYQGTNPDDIRDQLKKNKNLKDNYHFDISYSEPVTDSLSVSVGVGQEWKKSSEDRDAFDFDPTTQSYSNPNAFLTNYMSSFISTTRPNAGFSIDKKKFSLNASGGTAVSQFDAHSFYLGVTTDLNKNYVMPFANMYFNYKLDKSKQIYLNYDFEFDFPTASQILPVLDLSNPLNTFVGNANLNLNKTHNAYLGFNNYDYASRSGFYLYAGGNYYEDQIVSSSLYDENGKRTTTYRNVSDTYSSWSGASWSKSIKKEEHKYRFGAGVNVSFGLSKGFTNTEMYEAQAVRLMPRVFFNYDYGELLTIAPSYNFSYNETNYTNYTISSTLNRIHRFNIQTTNYWPKNWVFGNDFGYTYNSNISDDFKNAFYLWNTSLSYSFYDKKFTAKVKVYDMLNQNQSATRTISATTIRDEENTVLKRYAMFSLTYKIEKFAGKEKPSRNWNH
ncbi:MULTISPECIES: outer membrane beta-barrel protein [Flavobacterium]|uniref:outer membrane beta-barrel protein n=1 Tax=Flavobacterium TaxID=237 RepID=UPI001FCAEEC8|nr:MULTISPECIES: outer membrane beta-barrel protein [Flavobacterium]UOK42631.1 outer membrane beta-barrel protein [Flavobacterium enshiense]